MVSCSIPGCRDPVVVELVAEPPPGNEAERTFGFCLSHGPEYYAQGYVTVDGKPYQARLT